MNDHKASADSWIVAKRASSQFSMRVALFHVSGFIVFEIVKSYFRITTTEVIQSSRRTLEINQISGNILITLA